MPGEPFTSPVIIAEEAKRILARDWKACDLIHCSSARPTLRAEFGDD
jgi:hypothetical protein